MSIEALEWARRQWVGDAHGKSLLRAIADYAGEDGACFPSLGRLSSDCEFSEDTVRRKLKSLEDGGWLVRIKSWMDEHGRRNTEGRGRETSHEIRLLLKKAPTQPQACEDASLDSDEGSQPARVAGCEGSTVQGAGLQPATPGVAMVPPLYEPSSKREEDSPPYPPSGGDGPEIEGREESEAKWHGSDTWPEFEKAWQEPILRQSIARQVWSALSTEEWSIVIKAAKGYVAWRAKQRKPPNVINAHTFLRERDAWAGYVKLAPADAAPKPLTMFPIGSCEFAALALARAIARLPSLPSHTTEITIKGDVPAGAAGLAALVHFSPGAFEVDQSRWTLATKGTPRYASWCERVREWIGFWPEDHRFWLDHAGNIVPTAQQAEGYGDRLRLPRSCDGLLLPPLDFPPPKHPRNDTS